MTRAERLACPRCGSRRTFQIVWGLMALPYTLEPWQTLGGCVVERPAWSCKRCRYRWDTE